MKEDTTFACKPIDCPAVAKPPVRVPALASTTMLVSLSSRYRKMTAWQNALITMLLADSTSMLLFSFQKPMSFLKARKSNTLCSMDTTMVSASR